MPNFVQIGDSHFGTFPCCESSSCPRGNRVEKYALVPPRSRTTPPEASCRELDGRTEGLIAPWQSKWTSYFVIQLQIAGQERDWPRRMYV